jgi:hypothetical protein
VLPLVLLHSLAVACLGLEGCMRNGVVCCTLLIPVRACTAQTSGCTVWAIACMLVVLLLLALIDFIQFVCASMCQWVGGVLQVLM